MAKRFTDTEKWKDEWYTDLSNDYKVIWQYLLDTCDNAGIYKRNIKLLNYYCNTNVSAEDILNVLKDRVSIISDEKWIINKFCVFQYGNDFLQSKNKAVVSAVNKLIENKLYDNTTNSVLIPYPYSIDTPKEQEQDKVKDKNKVKEEVKSIVEDKSKVEKQYSFKFCNDVYTQILSNINTDGEWLENVETADTSIGWKNLYTTLVLSDRKIDELKQIVESRHSFIRHKQLVN
jgi:hypothetical protein